MCELYPAFSTNYQAPFACHPDSTNSEFRCPEVVLRSYRRSSPRTSDYKVIAHSASPTMTDGWNTISDIFQATKHQQDAETLVFWFEDQLTKYDITVDDVSIVPLQSCDNLILNPTFDSGTASFWSEF